MEKDTAILCNTQNHDLYRHLEGDKYRNIRTGKEGQIADETASKIFVLEVEATLMLNKYPLIEELIGRLGLKLGAP